MGITDTLGRRPRKESLLSLPRVFQLAQEVRVNALALLSSLPYNVFFTLGMVILISWTGSSVGPTASTHVEEASTLSFFAYFHIAELMRFFRGGGNFSFFTYTRVCCCTHVV